MMLKKFRINGQKIIGEQGEIIGIVKDVIFAKTSTLHAIALLIEMNGKELEVPLSSIEIINDNLLIKSKVKLTGLSIEPPQFTDLKSGLIRIKVFPKAIRLLREKEMKQKEIPTVEININNILLSKCSICRGEISSIEEFTFCPSCLTPYHKSCINELLKSNSKEKCWNCSNIDLINLIQFA